MKNFTQNLENDIIKKIEESNLGEYFKKVDIKFINNNKNENLLDILITTKLGNIFVEIKIIKEANEFYLNSSSIYWNLDNVKLEIQILFLKLQTHILEYVYNNKNVVLSEINSKNPNENYEKKIKNIVEKGYKKLTKEEITQILRNNNKIEIKDYYIEMPIFLEIEKGKEILEIYKEDENYIFKNETLSKNDVIELLSQIYFK